MFGGPLNNVRRGCQGPTDSADSGPKLTKRALLTKSFKVSVGPPAFIFLAKYSIIRHSRGEKPCRNSPPGGDLDRILPGRLGRRSEWGGVWG